MPLPAEAGQDLSLVVARCGGAWHVAPDFAQQHQADQKLGEKDREGYMRLLAMRNREFSALIALRR